jgi:hypothetical protein
MGMELVPEMSANFQSLDAAVCLRKFHRILEYSCEAKFMQGTHSYPQAHDPMAVSYMFSAMKQ